MSNIYYNPNGFGMIMIAEIEYSDGNYQFDRRVVWRKMDTDEFYTARDSGCSCPEPFENCDLSNLDMLIYEELVREVRKEVDGRANITPDKALEFLYTVKSAIEKTLI